LSRVSPEWLALREPADTEARAADLVEQLRRLLPPAGRLAIHDLGCGTGSMRRWLAPQLHNPQHWVLYDRDADLLAIAAAELPGASTDGTAVTGETRQRDLAGADLVTASALLDMFTAEELERVVTACVGARCPALVTISVVGRVDLTPRDPLDQAVAEAFNAHQRRTSDGRRLLGPDAVAAAADAFTRLGADVIVRPSPWRLGALHAALAAAWVTGWVTAAVEQRPELAVEIAAYERRRLTEAADGRLGAVVHHVDMLALPA
jgi:trans-aconitate methyltransferase